MKLECSVIKDLYTLYKENELSLEVREAVEEHLKDCVECRNIYECGENFNDILKNGVDMQPSKKMDEKLMMKLKISRLKLVVLFIAAVFLITTYNSYDQSRHNLLIDIEQSQQTLYHLSFYIDYIKSDAPVRSFSEDIQSLNNLQNSIIRRDLNWIESSKLKSAPNELFLDFKVDSLCDILKLRYLNGTFSQRDEKAFSLLKQYFSNIVEILGNEGNNLNKLYEYTKLEALIKPIDIEKIAGAYNDINQLSLIYSKYNKFPEELSPLPSDILKQKLQDVYNMNDLEVKYGEYINTSIRLNGNCDYNVSSKKNSFHSSGTINAYTGKLQQINFTSSKTEGELLPLDYIRAKLDTFLKNEYSREQNFKTEYLGINYHFESNVDIKIYSFRVSPVVKGFIVNEPFQIAFEARTGNIFNLMKPSSSDLSLPEYDIDTTINISPEKGLENLKLKQDSNIDYRYVETFIIKSKLSGKYTLVHEYKNKNENKLYISTSSGNQEFAY